MSELTDHELIEEIASRLETKNSALDELQSMMSDLEEVNAKLKESEELKSQFLSNIRNEINNPLSSIMVLASNIKAITGDPDTVRSVADLVHSEACELEFQLNNIFTASELEAGKMPLNASRVQLLDLVNDVIDSVKAKKICETQTIILKSAVDQETVFKTDADKLYLVLTNLLSNAAKFSVEHDEIILEVDINAPLLIIKVIDHGPGIAKKDQQRIFDRFQQLDTGMCKSHKGHGLGLSITKALLDIVNGTVTVASEPDKGCTFTIVVPEVTDPVDDLSLTGNEELFFTEEGGDDEDDGIELF